MVNNSKLLHYDTLEEFRKEHYKDLYTEEDIVDSDKYILELTQQGSPDKYEIDDFFAILHKGGTKYLVRSKFISKFPIKVLTKSIKYSIKGDVYHLIEDNDFISLKVRAEKAITFKEMVDRLSLLAHSNKDHYRLQWFLELTQMMSRAYFRISTPPGFGKDSTVDVIGALLGNTHTIESNPTTAQLMKLTYSKHLGVNEVVGTPRAEWNRMQQYLLSVTAFKNKITRRSMNMKAEGGDTIDVSDHSISLMYNDIDCYPKGTKYFDDMASAPMKDRLPPLRLYGSMTEDFNSLEGVDVEALALRNKQWYLDIIRTFHYYKHNVGTELHNYGLPSLKGFPERWRTNLGRLFKVIDLYCDSQEEFDGEINTLLNAIGDYESMLSYPEALRNFAKKVKIKVDDFDENPNIHYVISVLNGRGEEVVASYVKRVRDADTFVEKVLLLDSFVIPKKVKKEVDLSEW